MYIILLNFMPVKALLRYDDFSIFFAKWRLSAILDLLYARWNRCSSLDNKQVVIFCALGLKMPIPANVLGFWGMVL